MILFLFRRLISYRVTVRTRGPLPWLQASLLSCRHLVRPVGRNVRTMNLGKVTIASGEYCIDMVNNSAKV